MYYKILFYILTLAASTLYLKQKKDKQNKDKPSDEIDKQISPEPIQAIDKKELENDEVIAVMISNPN